MKIGSDTNPAPHSNDVYAATCHFIIESPAWYKGKSHRVTRTSDNVRVYDEGVVGWVDVSLLVVLLAERERASIHTHAVNVRVASHCGLWQGQILKGGWK